MKRIVFMIFITSIFIMNVKAFEIDIDKININSRSNSLIQNLDKAYNIETPKFNKKIVNDEKAVEFAKKIVTLSFTNKTAEEKQQDIYPYMYISEDNGFDTLTGLIFIQSYLKDLRGSNAYDHVTELIEKGLISRNKDKNGRSFNIKTTAKFKEYFKLKGDVRSLVKTLNIDAGVKDEPNEKDLQTEVESVGENNE